MRTAAGLTAWAVAALCGAACAAETPDELYRPQVDIDADPPAFYSFVPHQERGEPKPDEWLHTEKPQLQSFEQYVTSHPSRATQARHTIYVAPIGTLSLLDWRRLRTIRHFLEIYYGLPVKFARATSLEGVPHRTVTAAGRQIPQYHVDDIRKHILEPNLTEDALCLLGVTMADVNAREDWRYAFGMAWHNDRMAVYSLARFYPEIWGEPETPDTERRGLRRSLRQCAKGIAHTLGLQACHKYYCLMNCTLGPLEADEIPLHPCPECLKKLRWNLGFDIINRYEALRKFYTRIGLKEETAWLTNRLRECRQARPAPTKQAVPAPAPQEKEKNETPDTP